MGLVVLGHELCGAIKAAQLPDEKLEEMPSHLEEALKGIKAGLDLEGLKNLKDARALDREALSCNVKRQVETLCRDKVIMGKVRKEELLVVGGFYEQPQQEVHEDTSRWEGFSMEEARAHADGGQSMVIAKTPTEIFADLQRGNTRFWTGRASRPEASFFDRRALLNKQFPSVALLACADSRVPTEMIFDQGLGDLFVVRVAGNALDASTHGSLQFAVNVLKVKVLVVLGHELCGAIKAAQLPDEKLEEM